MKSNNDNMLDIWSNTSHNSKKYGSHKITINNMDDILASNGVFSSKNTPWFTKFNRYGNLNPTDTYSANREFLFFTKPDLYIYDNIDYSSLTLRQELQNIPKFVDWDKRHKDSLVQLQYSVNDKDGYKNPFMYLLSNGVTSKMDIPAITAESKESTPNIYGTSIQYRSHSLKSDNGYDFTLSFTDTAYLEIYFLAKAYDEYLRMLKTGDSGLCPKKDHILNRILPELFSIYKFIISDDGETIMYYTKATGVYIADVPRSDFSDPPQDGFKFSLSFHAQFIEDNNPLILSDFNNISPATKQSQFVDVYDTEHMRVNNDWVRFPYIVKSEPRVKKSGAKYDYRLKWVK